MDIQLITLYRGSVKRVVALVIDGRNPVSEFYGQHESSHEKQLDQLRARVEMVANTHNYRNTEAFRPLGDGLFEFRTRQGLRLYAFQDEGHLIIATNGGGKKKQSSDISKARQLKNDYYNAKKQSQRNPNIKIRIVP